MINLTDAGDCQVIFRVFSHAVKFEIAKIQIPISRFQLNKDGTYTAITVLGDVDKVMNDIALDFAQKEVATLKNGSVVVKVHYSQYGEELF